MLCGFVLRFLRVEARGSDMVAKRWDEFGIIFADD